MDLSEILAIAGKPGLFKLLTQTSKGVVIESLVDRKKQTVFAHERISSLEEISIYTSEEDMPLKEVFKAIFKLTEGGKAISHKGSGAELRAFMEEAVPNFDDERVYTSDIKKMIQWYNILLDAGLMVWDEKEDEQEDQVEQEEKTTEDSE